MTFEDSARGYYMAWYARDRFLSWRRERIPELDDANLDRHDPGPHAPNPDRTWYYYRVSFCSLDGRHSGQVPGGRFGVPLGSADQFPGWDVVARHWQTVMEEWPRAGQQPQVYLL